MIATLMSLRIAISPLGGVQSLVKMRDSRDDDSCDKRKDLCGFCVVALENMNMSKSVKVQGDDRSKC